MRRDGSWAFRGLPSGDYAVEVDGTISPGGPSGGATRRWSHWSPESSSRAPCPRSPQHEGVPAGRQNDLSHADSARHSRDSDERQAEGGQADVSVAVWPATITLASVYVAVGRKMFENHCYSR